MADWRRKRDRRDHALRHRLSILLGQGLLHIRKAKSRAPPRMDDPCVRDRFAVATIRPIVGVFFATSRLTHLTPRDFFGTAFWLGFTMQLMVAEIWINYTRKPSAVVSPQEPCYPDVVITQETA